MTQPETLYSTEVVEAPGITDKCAYCYAALHGWQNHKAKWELDLCGVHVDVTIPQATHFAYPFTGNMAGNAYPVCRVHAALIQGENKFGTIDAFMAHVEKLREEQKKAVEEERELRKILAELDAASAREVARCPDLFWHECRWRIAQTWRYRYARQSA
jgi:hypothetical protein